MGTRAAAPTTHPSNSVTSLPTLARFLLPFSGAEPFLPNFERERERDGGDGGGRAAEGKRTRRRQRLLLQLASPRPVAPQIRELASSSHTLQFTSHGLRIQDCVLFRENLDEFAPH